MSATDFKKPLRTLYQPGWEQYPSSHIKPCPSSIPSLQVLLQVRPSVMHVRVHTRDMLMMPGCTELLVCLLLLIQVA